MSDNRHPGPSGKTPIDTDQFDVHAAGGVPWRHAADGSLEVVVVHRPRYDDWSFPKGKLDPGETFEHAAVRELAEETGFAVDLGDELPAVTYTDRNGRSKVVRWWAMTVLSGAFAPNDEVDELAWASPDAAAAVLTYDTDVETLDALVNLLNRR